VPVSRPYTPPAADERAMLTAFLDYQRATIEMKVDGIDDAQARTCVEPSDISLLGIVRHLTEVERNWFRNRFLAEDAPSYYRSESDTDGDWHAGPDDTLEDAVALYRAECERARAIVRNTSSLDDESKVRIWWKNDEPVTLRWILVHMIEETARHAGHADLLRERIDGVTGE
jgi:uncharacterized damage-inducible protein DinB